MKPVVGWCDPIVSQIAEKHKKKMEAYDAETRLLEKDMTFHQDLLDQFIKRLEGRVFHSNNNPENVTFDIVINPPVSDYWAPPMKKKVDDYDLTLFKFDGYLYGAFSKRHASLVHRNILTVANTWNQRHPTIKAGLVFGYQLTRLVRK